MKAALQLCVALCALGISMPAFGVGKVIKDGDTLVFMGDSITQFGKDAAASGAIPSAENAWMHIAGVFAGTNFTAYANGEKVFGATVPPVKDSDNPLVFGSNDRRSWQGHFTGLFDEFRLRDAASSADWVKAEYDQAKPGFLTADTAMPKEP